MRSLAQQIKDRQTTNARHLEEQHLTETAAMWRLCQRGQDDALAPVEHRREEAACVQCVVTTLREPVEVRVADKLRGLTDLCIYLPIGTEVQDDDELRVNGREYGVLGVMDGDTGKTLLPVYVVRRN